MSLRAFHLVFIILSALLAVFFAAWSSSQFRAQQELVYAVVAVAGVLAAAGLTGYAVRFRRRTAHF
jgi:hypothetical protein